MMMREQKNKIWMIGILIIAAVFIVFIAQNDSANNRLHPLTGLSIDSNNIQSISSDSQNHEIRIISAEHIDSEGQIISDIYEEVKDLDGIWSETIEEGHYVRVTFEQNLTRINDITIYPRTITGYPSIKVHEKDSNDTIAMFSTITDNEYNKVFLTGMESESQDTFDLHILDGSVQFDHIVDPPTVVNYTANGTFTVPPGVTEITIEAWGAGGAGGGAASAGGSAGSGGGGGQYARVTISVSADQIFNVSIGLGGIGSLNAAGTEGGNTSFFNVTNTYVKAVGGSGGAANSGTIGVGNRAGSIGSVIYYGGNGTNPTGDGGGGGGAAGNSTHGNTASGSSGGAGGTGNPSTGDGGDGIVANGNADGNPGSIYGGGGGGGRKHGGGTATRAGGDGAQGFVRITYTPSVSAPAAPTNVAATDGTHNDKVVVSWTKSSGATGYYIRTTQDGLIGTVGDVDTFDYTSAPAGTITPGTASASDGTSTEHVSLSVSGQGTANGASRTYYVIAYNAAGNSSDSTTDTGYRGVGALSYQWQRSDGDSDASYSNIVGATTASYDDTGAPADGSGRYYRVLLNADGATQQTSTSDRGYRAVAASPPDAPTNVAATKGTHNDKVVVNWTKSDGATGYKVYEGTNLLGTLGDVDTYDDTTAPAGTITPGTASASDGTSTEHVSLSVSGHGTTNGATRTYKVVAFNAEGDSPDSTTDTGYRGVGSISYQWQRSDGDSDASYSNIVGATTASYDDTGAPADGSGRYYRVLLNANGATQQTSTSDRGYRDVAPDETPIYSNFDGSTTDFSSEGDLSSVYQPILEVSSHGRIQWQGTVDARNQNFNSHVTISNNLIRVQSASMHTSFNSPAQIRFYGLSYSDTPILLKDSLPCSSPQCNITSYSAGTLIADVEGFSDYTTMEQSSDHDQAWTIAAWVNIEDTGGTQFLVQGINLGLMLVNGTSDRMMMYLNSGDDDYYAYTAPGLLAGQGWKHVAFVFRNEDSYRKIYVDGNEVTILGPDMTTTPFGMSPTLNVGANTVGEIDEFIIFGRILHEEEIKSIFDAGQYQYRLNITGLEAGEYEYRAYSTDEAGNYVDTDMRIVTIQLDTDPPYWSTNMTNETSQSPRINENIQMNLTLHDDFDLYSYIFSWNGTGSWQNDTIQYISGKEHNMSKAKQVGLTRGNTIGWRAFIYDTTGKTNISDIFTFTVKNTPPNPPILQYPEDGDDLFINRTPTFNWTYSDADNDVLTFNIEVALDQAFSTIIVNETGIASNQFFQGVPLDIETIYYWRVLANDSYNISDWSATSNFTIVPYTSITLDNDVVSFGTLRINEANDTTNDNPMPIIVRNTGNIETNITLNATTFWTTQPIDTSFYQFKARSFLSNAFLEAESQMTFTNMSSTKLLAISHLNWHQNSSGYIDLRVLVPPAEPPGDRNSTIHLRAVTT
jgi:hypothetical protein